MKRNLLPALAFTIATTQGCGGDSTLLNIENAKAAYIERYGCADPDFPVTFKDMTAEEQDISDRYGAEDADIGGYTSRDGVFINKKDSPSDQASNIVHETGHGCTDKKSSSILEYPIELPFQLGTITAIEGFSVYLDGSLPGDETVTLNNHTEEGIVHWLVGDIDGYQIPEAIRQDDDAFFYEEIGELADRISKIGKFGREETAQLLNSDNLLGYVALAKNKNEQDVTPEDIADITCAFTVTYLDQSVPPEEVILRYFRDPNLNPCVN